EAIVKTIREFYKKDFDPSDVRTSILSAISVRIQEPVFESQTKTKLGSLTTAPDGPQIRSWINDFVKVELDNYLHKNPAVADSITKARNVNTQAVFSLKGKPLNCYGLTKKVVYENEEFNLLQSALNIEDGLDELRYNKVVVATDADVDGMHIRLLLMTFFLQF